MSLLAYKVMKVFNKTAPATFKIEEKFEAGIVLLGSEVKAVKEGHLDLSGSYVKLIGSEAYLVNAKIFPYKYARIEGYDESKTRKLLLHKKEILALRSKLSQGNLTIVPTAMYTIGELVKLEIASARGKKQYEKREDIKKRDIKKQVDEEIKNRRGDE